MLGNHEYHRLAPQRRLELAKKLEGEPSLIGKLTLLNRTRVDLDDEITLLGCTLWSHVPDQSQDIVRTKINDIKGHISGWTVENHNSEHEKDLLWLQSEIEQLAKASPRRSIIVATHHAPSVSGTSSELDSNNAWSPASATELIDGVIRTWQGHKMIRYWIFGHTHHFCQISRRNIKILANQHGYFPTLKSITSPPNATKKVPSFDSRKCIAINSVR